jgi:flagellar motor switch/type III secretory pathway protein FliN
MNALPFPWKSLDSVRRADLAMLAKLRRASSRLIDAPSAESALRELLGPCELSIRTRRVTSNPARVDDNAVAALLAPAERADKRRAFAIVLEQSLASALASRALKRPAARVIDPARPSPSLAGAVAAILVAAARKNALAPLRVISAGSAHAIVAEVVAIDPMPLTASFTVVLDHDAHLAQVLAPRSALEPIAEPGLDARALASLGAMPIEIPLVAGVLEMTTTELAALAPGDALLPLTLSPDLRGELLLAPPESDVAFVADLGEGGRLVLREGPEKTMVDKDVLAQSIGEAPVVVRVEVGSAQMSAREWAALGAGDVIALGKRIGDHVVLRAGGVEIARGELVDVEGEIGVRIIARSGGTLA